MTKKDSLLVRVAINEAFTKEWFQLTQEENGSSKRERRTKDNRTAVVNCLYRRLRTLR